MEILIDEGRSLEEKQESIAKLQKSDKSSHAKRNQLLGASTVTGGFSIGLTLTAAMTVATVTSTPLLIIGLALFIVSLALAAITIGLLHRYDKLGKISDKTEAGIYQSDILSFFRPEGRFQRSLSNKEEAPVPTSPA